MFSLIRINLVCYKGHVMENKPLARKLGAFVALSNVELRVLEALHARRRVFVAGRDLVHQGQAEQSAYILISGWACSYKILPNGERQIVDFQLPGDFLGLRSVLLHMSDHSIEPVTDIEVTEVHVSDLLEVFANTPRLATAVLWAASRDEAVVVEHLAGIGRRNATERMAHFLLELGARLTLIGMGSRKGFDCPLTQYLLADALGLSPVHVNRVLRHLREAGMLTFRDGVVTFHDYVKLAEFAQFDPTYLDQVGPLLPL
jgi:CRP-like cAMP-binding protein